MSGEAAQTFREISCEDARFLRLLRDASLPVEDLDGSHKRFWGLFDARDGLVAAGGLEIYRGSGIVRSCVVRDTARGQGLGAALVGFLASQACAAGVQDIYLLTQTAQAWFEGLGFEPVERANVPAEIAASSQFAGICPASAASLRRSLRSPS